MGTKKTILHFIDRLGRGGAETLLVKVTKELKDYNNIIVILGSDNRFGEELVCYKLIKLNITSLFFYWTAIFKLRKIITQNKVHIVHSHLFWPNIIARFATPKKVPLITTIHAFIANSLEYKHKYVCWLEKFSFWYRDSIILTVANGALEEYKSFLNINPKLAFVNYTFADLSVFNFKTKPGKENNSPIKIISVGALRQQKNYCYLINAFKSLKDKRIELHIYGSGPLEESLTAAISKEQVNIVLKGEVNNIHEILPQYDFFTLSSTYEGFSLAVIEAMALKLPLVLSDIPSFKEQCEATAVYFNLNEPVDFSQKLLALVANPEQCSKMADAAHQRAINNFTPQNHINNLKSIYQKILFATS